MIEANKKDKIRAMKKTSIFFILIDQRDFCNWRMDLHTESFYQMDFDIAFATGLLVPFFAPVKKEE